MNCKAILAVTALVGLSACQTTGNAGWTDWEGIPRAEAKLAWENPESVDLMARKVPYNGNYQELWTWQSGAVFVALAGHAYYYRESVGPQNFGEIMAGWKRFESSGESFPASRVREGKNQYGSFYYATIESDVGDECWGFVQDMPTKFAAGYRMTDKPSGQIFGYDCSNALLDEKELLRIARSYTVQN